MSELYWTIAGDWIPLLTVANFSGQRDTVTVAITYNGGKFVLPEIPLLPLQSKTINVRDLVAQGVRDRNGGLWPKDVTFGGYQIEGADAKSKLVVREHLISSSLGISVPFYGTPVYATSLIISPSPMDVIISYDYGFSTWLTWSDGGVTDDCGWVGTRDSSIATASKSYFYCTNTLHPVAAGSTYVDAQSQYAQIDSFGTWGYLYAAPVQVTVRVPTSVGLVMTNAQGAAVCPAGQAGWSRNVTLQLQDQFGAAYRAAGIRMADMIYIGNPNNLGASNTQTGAFNTDAGGRWPDTYFVCSSVCPGNAGETDALQYWTWNTLPLPRQNVIVYKCGSITVDGR